MHTVVNLLITLALIALNAFFVAAEFAAVGARRTRLEEQAEGSSLGELALKVKDSLDLYLSACQLGITIASLGLGFVTEEALVGVIKPLLGNLGGLADSHAIAVTAALTISTALHVSVGEVAPKNVAIRMADRILPFLAPPLIGFTYLFYPAIWILNEGSNLLLRLLGIEMKGEGHEEPLHSIAEIRSLLEQSIEEGEIRTASSALLSSAFKFDDLTVKQIMIPRPDVHYLMVGQPASEVVDAVRRSAYTRFPLVEGEVDNIVGLVHMKDVFNVLIGSGDAAVGQIDLLAIKRDIHIVPETLELPRLLRRFQRSRVHMAAVVDEYGSLRGIVTLEDIIEELVGEIDDEFDERSRPLFQREGDRYRVLSSIALHQLADELDLSELKESEATTLNGYFVQTLGRLPAVGDTVPLGPFVARIAGVKDKRTSEVIIAPREVSDA